MILSACVVVFPPCLHLYTVRLQVRRVTKGLQVELVLRELKAEQGQGDCLVCFCAFFFKNSSWNNHLNIATIHITLADFNLTCCMFFSMQVALVLQAILAIQDLKATRVRMDFLDHLVKKEKRVRGIAGKLSK